MIVQKVLVNQINPAPHNPRVELTPEDPEYQKLEQSITNFGYVDPVIWNCRTGNLVGGHQRFKILIAQGLTEIDVSVVDLSLEKEKALNIALNKIQGRWDEDKLAILLDELSNLPDLDVSLTGFDLPEISEILDRAVEAKDDDFDFDEAIKDIETPITQRGDLIELGNHRLLCGDSANPDDFKLLMGSEKADILNCDYPYNVRYGECQRPQTDRRPKKERKWDHIYFDDMPQAEYENWMRRIFQNIKEFLRPGAPIYVWQGHRQFPPMYQILLDLDFHVSCVICWEKEMIVISYADYSFQTEQCLYGWLKGAPHYWAGPANETTLWKVHRDPTKTYIHPTQKPVELAARAIRNSSKRGDIVLDVFFGSASTLIAAESLGRRCFGLELDPKYCDGIVRRYIAYVGEDKISPELRQRYVKEVQDGRSK